MRKITRDKAILRLEALKNEALEIDPNEGQSRQFRKWSESVNSAFIHIFGEDSRQYLRLPGSYTINPAGIREYLDAMVSMVESNLEDIKTFWDDNETIKNEPIAQSRTSSRGSPRSERKKLEKKIFVVHGHDDASRESVARFLESLTFEAIVLHEQSDKGRTIIEKIEDHSDVSFAVVLMTPDDLGAAKTEIECLRPRARQNVIFELGYFIGRLGRKNVYALKNPEVETPSDYDGVVYTNLDASGGWKLNLIRELKSAGFEFDANTAM